MLWSYLAAIQMQDIDTNDGTKRFREARGYFNAAYAKAESLTAALAEQALRIEELEKALQAAQPAWREIDYNDRETLPEKDGMYLVTASDGDYFTDVAEFIDGEFNYGDVVAWAPRPEPFQGEKRR